MSIQTGPSQCWLHCQCPIFKTGPSHPQQLSHGPVSIWIGPGQHCSQPGSHTFQSRVTTFLTSFHETSALESHQAEGARAGRTVSLPLALAGEVFLQRMKSAGVFAKGRGIGDLFPVTAGPSPLLSPPPGPCSWAVPFAQPPPVAEHVPSKGLGVLSVITVPAMLEESCRSQR